jgi:hypothetical protein
LRLDNLLRRFVSVMNFAANRRSGFSAESRTLQLAGEMLRSADRRFDERGFLEVSN